MELLQSRQMKQKISTASTKSQQDAQEVKVQNQIVNVEDKFETVSQEQKVN